MEQQQAKLRKEKVPYPILVSILTTSDELHRLGKLGQWWIFIHEGTTRKLSIYFGMSLKLVRKADMPTPEHLSAKQ